MNAFVSLMLRAEQLVVHNVGNSLFWMEIRLVEARFTLVTNNEIAANPLANVIPYPTSRGL